MSSSSAVPPVHRSVEAIPERLGINASLRPTVSWQAVFAGVVVAIAIELLLAVLGLAIGLTVANPGQGGANGLGLAAAIWWIVSAIISLFIGGYAGARLANVPTRYDGLLQGLVIWGVSVLVSVWVLSAAATGLVHGVVTALGGTLSAVTHGIETTAPQIASAIGTNQGGAEPGAIQGEVQSLFSAQNQEPQQMSRDQAVSAVVQTAPDLLAGGDKAAAAKTRIAEILAAQLHISQADAEKRVDQFEQRLEQLKAQAAQTAKNVAGQATGIASDAAFAIFVALIVTAFGAGVGGAVARPRRVLRRPERWSGD